MPPKRPARIVVTVGDVEEEVLAFAATDGLCDGSVPREWERRSGSKDGGTAYVVRLAPEEREVL